MMDSFQPRLTSGLVDVARERKRLGNVQESPNLLEVAVANSGIGDSRSAECCEIVFVLG
jgi:hypothetical protein